MSRMMRTSQELLRTALSHGVLVMLVGSVALNAALARELRESRWKSDRQLVAGTIVPPIVGKSTDGNAVTLRYRDELATVLYYFSPACGWCERNWHNLQAVVNATRNRFRIVGLADSQEAAAHPGARGVAVDVVTGFDDTIRSAYRLGGTPQTIVVGPDGRVVRVWAGAYAGRLAEEIEEFFGVRLPGLTERPRTDEASAPR